MRTTRTIRRFYIIFALIVLGGLLVNSIGPILFANLLQRVANLEQIEVILGTFFPLLGYLIMAGGLIFVASDVLQLYLGRVMEFQLGGVEISFKEELDSAKKRAQAEPEKAKPAWDLARVKLELYFDRNLSQINYIFWLSVVVMMIGFGFILFGISRAFNPVPTVATEVTPNAITPAVVGMIAGIITEFIGATFLFLYRSTVQQAVAYTRSLERINSVGMAMQILDTISSEAKELQDKTKAELVRLLLTQSNNLTDDASTE